MQAALKAIAEHRRREILRLVGAGEMTAGEIASHFEVTRPAISQHLTVLKDAGLLAERREGTRRIYRLRPEAVEQLRAFLDEMWGEGLQALKREAEAEERRGTSRSRRDRAPSRSR
jgi:DNA-binding transcriptional ArsR family regulator